MLHNQTVQLANQQNSLWKSWYPKRGEIYLISLDGIDSEQKGLRPFVLLSNNIGNSAGSILVGCSITSKNKIISKIHVRVGKEEGLKYESYIMTEHIRSVSKQRFFINGVYPIKVGQLSESKMVEVEIAIMFELGII